MSQANKPDLRYLRIVLKSYIEINRLTTQEQSSMRTGFDIYHHLFGFGIYTNSSVPNLDPTTILQECWKERLGWNEMLNLGGMNLSISKTLKVVED